jgi:DNA-binding response OmpR family regulator
VKFGGPALSEVPRKRVLVADADEVVAFIASHILARYEFDVDTVTCAAEFIGHRNGYDAVVVSDAIATEVVRSLDPSRAVILGDSVPGFKAFARLRKPLELDLLVATVGACAHRRI